LPEFLSLGLRQKALVVGITVQHRIISGVKIGAIALDLRVLMDIE